MLDINKLGKVTKENDIEDSRRALKSLSLLSYKTFDKETIEFGKMTDLIGANASGKSNVVSAVELLGRLSANSTEDAISLSGGVTSIISTGCNGGRRQTRVVGSAGQFRMGLYLEYKNHMAVDVLRNRLKKKHRPKSFTMPSPKDGNKVEVIDWRVFYALVYQISPIDDFLAAGWDRYRPYLADFIGSGQYGIEIEDGQCRKIDGISLEGEVAPFHLEEGYPFHKSRSSIPLHQIARIHLHRGKLRGYLPDRLADYGEDEEFALDQILCELNKARFASISHSDQIDNGIIVSLDSQDEAVAAALKRLDEEFNTIVTPCPVTVQNYEARWLAETHKQSLLESSVKPKQASAEVRFGAIDEGLKDASVSFDVVKKFDFSPRLMKSFQVLGTESSLKADGSNIASFLNTKVGNPECRERRQYDSRIMQLIPFYRGFEVKPIEYTSDCILLFEEGFETCEGDSVTRKVPSMNISDGSAIVLGLVAALFLDEAPLILLEEPERCLNPKNVRTFIEMCKEASASKQLIITTHNPEMVRWLDFEDVRVVFRDERGISHVKRPIDLEMVRYLAEKNVKLDNIFANSAFGV